MNRVFGHLAGTPEYERFIMGCTGHLYNVRIMCCCIQDELFAEILAPTEIRADRTFDSVEGVAKKCQQKRVRLELTKDWHSPFQ